MPGEVEVLEVTVPEPVDSGLRVEPHMLPELIAAYQRAADSVQHVAQSIYRRGRVPEPWTHDPHTANLTWTFNQWAVDAPDSAYRALLTYQQELASALTTLTQMLADYERTESGIAGDVSRA